jgi:hypothetical protein
MVFYSAIQVLELLLEVAHEVERAATDQQGNKTGTSEILFSNDKQCAFSSITG